MANDPHDNEADDRTMLRKLRDQEDTVNNDDERDYAEEQYNAHLLDDETDPDEFEILVTRDSRGFQISTAALRQAAASGSAVIRFTAPDGYQFGSDRRLHPDNERGKHRSEARRLAGLAERSDPEYATGPGLAAVTRALLALSAPDDREPEGTWRQRAVEAEAALTAIGGIVISYQNFPSEIDLVGEIERILRTSGRKARGFAVHTGMLAHDGFLPHSHEVRPDHYSVPREKP